MEPTPVDSSSNNLNPGNKFDVLRNQAAAVDVDLDKITLGSPFQGVTQPTNLDLTENKKDEPASPVDPDLHIALNPEIAEPPRIHGEFLGLKTFGNMNSKRVEKDPQKEIEALLGETKTEKEETKQELPAHPLLEGEVVDEPVTEPATIPENVLEAEVVPEAIPIVNPKVELPETQTTPSAETLEASEKLEVARDEYATQLIAWKNENRKKKNFLDKIFSDLGVEKKLPDSAKSAELIEAENAYILAKKNKAKSLFANGIPMELQNKRTGEVVREYTLNEDLMNQATTEHETLQRRLIDSLPPLEKGRITKAFEWWAKQPQSVRLAASSVLMTGVGLVFGGVTLGGAAAYGGYRVFRAAGGLAASQGAGKLFDMMAKKINKKDADKALSEFGTNIDMDNFDAKERERMKAMDNENTLKKQRVLKAAIMVGAAGFGSMEAGSVTNSLHSVDVPSGGGGSVAEHVAPKGPSVKIPVAEASGNIPHEVVSPDINIETLGVTPAEVPTQTIPSIDAPQPLSSQHISENVVPEKVFHAKVGLSSKGFIQDIHNLKEQISEEYQGKEMPTSLKENILNKSDMEIAKELHFYDAEHNASAVGLKGESLSVEDDGSLSYERLDGTKQTMWDAKAGKVHEFSGQMKVYPDTSHVEPPAPQFDKDGLPISEPNAPGESPIDTEGAPIRVEDSSSTIRTAMDVGAKPAGYHSLMGDSSLSPENATEAGIQPVEILDKAGSKVIAINGTEIAHEQGFGNGKILALDDKFQDGNQYKDVRAAFATAFEKNTLGANLGETPTAIPFEGGKIYIVQGIPGDQNGIHVLLNGKEIAKGAMTVTGPKVSIHSELKGGWFLADTVFERAMKVADNVLKKAA